MTFNENPYYHPEKCGLSIFDQIDTAGSYEFDIFCIWEKDEDHTLWWDSDSGCSCPSPFDPGDHGHDLKPITIDTLYNFEEALKNHINISKDDYKRMYNKVKNYINTQNK
jgi:hypothetical protein